jgi:DNA-binding NarL/FixJ family response regulator
MAKVRLRVTANRDDRLPSNETFVNRIRILFWKMPPMLLDIITDTIAPQPDMDIVGRGKMEMDLLDAAKQTNADIVITARSTATEYTATEYKDYDELLYRHCRIKVLEILDEGRSGSLCEMRPRRVALGEMSPLRLLEAIRGSADIAARVES